MSKEAEDLKKLEEGAKSLKAALDTVEQCAKDGKKISEAVADVQKKFDDQSKEVGKVMEELQASKTKEAAIEQKMKELEISISRNPSAKSADVDKAKELQHEAMDIFLRKGTMRGNASDAPTSLDKFVEHFLDAKKIEMKDLVGSGIMCDKDGKVIEGKSGTSLRVGSDVDGGFLVLPEFGGIVTTQIFETSPVRQYADVITIATDAYEFVDDYDQVTSGWVGEVSARPVTGTPQIGKRRIPVHEQYALTNQTQKMLEDGIVNVESWVTGKIADKFARTENAAFIKGTGETQPMGMTSYGTQTSATYTPGKLQYVASGSTTVFAYTNLTNLVGSLKFDYFQDAAFFTNRQTLPNLLQVVDGIQRPIFNLVFDKNTKTFGNMMGLPLAIFNDMPIIASNAYPIAFGSLKKAYAVVDRRGINLLRDPYSNKPYVQFYATKRVGGDIVNWEALKLHKMATS